MKIALHVLLILLIVSCSKTRESADGIPDRTIFSPGDRSVLFNKLAELPQQFSIDNRFDTLITGKNGTSIFFPKGCFVDNDSDKSYDNVNIELVEALSIKDMVLYNLQTMSNDNLILQTAGMLYINAKFNDKNLAIKKGVELNIQMQSSSNQSNLNVFNGTRNSDGDINWTLKKPIDNGMIPMPLKTLDLKYYTSYRYTLQEPEIIHYLDSITILNDKFKNTYLSTLAFKKRFDMLNCSNGYWWEGYDRYFKAIDTDSGISELEKASAMYMTKPNRKFNINCQPLNIYIENIDKPLWYSDSLVYNYLQKYRSAIPKFELSKSSNDTIWWTYLPMITRVDGTRTFYHNFNTNYAKAFLNEHRTTTKTYDPKGVNMSSPMAKELLVKKGYSISQANEQIFIYKLRAQYTKEVEKEKEKRLRHERFVANKNASYNIAFKTSELGWLNIDRFLIDKTMGGTIQISVKNKTDISVNTNIIIPKMNILINSHSISEDTKLPIGEDAIIIAMSYKNDVPYIALKKIKIKKEQTIDLELEATTWEDLKKLLTEIK